MVKKKLKNLVRFDLFTKDERWIKLKFINEHTITTLITKTIEYLKLNSQLETFECTIFLTNDIEIQEHNKKYRGKNSPTNTLSFPTEALMQNKKISTFSGYFYAGEIFLALETIETESTMQRKNFYNHFYHLLLHSVLHLLGYNHENIDDQNKMEKIEIKILKQLGIANPYE